MVFAGESTGSKEGFQMPSRGYKLKIQTNLHRTTNGHSKCLETPGGHMESADDGTTHFLHYAKSKGT